MRAHAPKLEFFTLGRVSVHYAGVQLEVSAFALTSGARGSSVCLSAPRGSPSRSLSSLPWFHVHVRRWRQSRCGAPRCSQSLCTPCLIMPLVCIPIMGVPFMLIHAAMTFSFAWSNCLVQAPPLSNPLSCIRTLGVLLPVLPKPSWSCDLRCAHECEPRNAPSTTMGAPHPAPF